MLPVKQLRGVIVSSTAPSNPQNGDRWLEVNSSRESLYGWEWTRDSFFWRSPTQTWESSFDSVTNAGQGILALDDRFRFLPLRASYTFLLSTANNSSNFWQWQLQIMNATGAINVSTAITSTGVSASTWTRISASFGSANAGNAFVGARILRTLTGNPGAVSGSVKLLYQYARI